MRDGGQGDLFEGPSLESPHDLAAADTDFEADMNAAGSDGEGEAAAFEAATAVVGGTAVGLPEVTSAIDQLLGLLVEMCIDGEDGHISSKRQRREEDEGEELGGLEYFDQDFQEMVEAGASGAPPAQMQPPDGGATQATVLDSSEITSQTIIGDLRTHLEVDSNELDRALARISALEQAAAVHEKREQEVKCQLTLRQQENIGLRQSCAVEFQNHRDLKTVLDTPFLHLACENVKSLMDKMQGYFECAKCKALKPKFQFSNTQKNQGATVRKCLTCTTPGGGIKTQR